MRILITIVWLINGLFCKILNLVPRHEAIVSRILGDNYSRELTVAIGVLEVIMVLWILSEFKSRLNAQTQISVILLMNIIEFIYAPDLLLWGKFNILFASLFVVIIYMNEFKLIPKKLLSC
ncbi:DoxX-like family protein [uncultured Tenacibaculum sp.]|uniref:DoxX-like family protein n=1 Tax=uncultured Tenacibaculum sp. TaxID=174713 RepID=UPI0026023181|nr:DoxX-like family protein [uncultured Tenacibaculum sp.]